MLDKIREKLQDAKDDLLYYQEKILRIEAKIEVYEELLEEPKEEQVEEIVEAPVAPSTL